MDDLSVYRWLVVCRELDAALCELNPRWFPVEGEEATVVGTFCDLRPGDVAAPHYRDPFAVYLMRGAEMWRLVAQVLGGKPDGYNRGRSVPFNGPFAARIVPWVAGDLGTTLGVATGAGLALQEQAEGGVCVCTFGDGTAYRDDFTEALNLAAVWQLPVVYVCQHNGWAISQPATSYLPAPVVERAAGYGMPGVWVDGNDVEAVRSAVGEAVGRARTGEGPTLIEARTWRLRGHWAADGQAYRTQPEPDGLEDPLDLQAYRLLERGLVDEAQLERLHAQVAGEIEVAVRQAQAARDADASDLGLDEVYA